MAITQLTTLELLPSQTSTSTRTSLTSPPLNHLIPSLCARQSVYSAYPVTPYADLHSSRVFYLLSGWRDTNSISSWTNDLKNPDTNHGGICEKLREFVKIRDCVYLDMDFDRIPRGVKANGRVLCVVRNPIGRESADGDDDDDDNDDEANDENHRFDGRGRGERGIETGQGGFEVSSGATGGMNGELSLYRRSECCSEEEEGFDSDDSDAEPCQIEWIGGGRDLRVLERQGHDSDSNTREIFHSFIMYREGTSERALQRKLGRRVRSRDFTAMRRISMVPAPVTLPAGGSLGYSLKSSEQQLALTVR